MYDTYECWNLSHQTQRSAHLLYVSPSYRPWTLPTWRNTTTIIPSHGCSLGRWNLGEEDSKDCPHRRLITTPGISSIQHDLMIVIRRRISTILPLPSHHSRVIMPLDLFLIIDQLSLSLFCVCSVVESAHSTYYRLTTSSFRPWSTSPLVPVVVSSSRHYHVVASHHHRLSSTIAPYNHLSLHILLITRSSYVVCRLIFGLAVSCGGAVQFSVSSSLVSGHLPVKLLPTRSTTAANHSLSPFSLPLIVVLSFLEFIMLCFLLSANERIVTSLFNELLLLRLHPLTLLKQY